MINLYKEFMGWINYNFSQVEITPFQQAVLRTIFNEEVPKTKKELAERLEDLLPKSRKKSSLVLTTSRSPEEIIEDSLESGDETTEEKED